jgi:hypothetical protein
MAWDLRGSLLKKEERESARLAAFEFKLRARSFARLAEALEAPSAEIVPLVAGGDDASVLRELAQRFPDRSATLEALYLRCRAEARARLVAEEGDPAPHRLA